jgi:SAM-dependent methyltransferase
MKTTLRTAYGYANRLGLDPLTGVANLRGVPRFMADLQAFKKANTQPEVWPIGTLNPCLKDRYEESGAASGHYFHQDLLVARRIHLRAPQTHVDVGSRIDGFVAHVASFRAVEVFDIRELTSTVPNVEFRQCDITSTLPQGLQQSCDSLSCLHALEHFGLGRYGDAIDPDGHRAALANLALIVRPGGWFYLSVPIGPQRIEFNAHRVFAVDHLLALVEPMFEARAISYVDDAGDLHEDVGLDHPGRAVNFACRYGCAIVEMVRRS